MSVEFERIRSLVMRDYVTAIEERYAAAGMVALRVLTPALDVLHEQLAYELLAVGLTAFTTLDPDDRPLPADQTIEVRSEQLPGLVRGAATVQVLHDGTLLVVLDAVDPFALAERAVVYHFNGADHFAIGSDLVPVFNPTGYPSIWGIPTFFDLQAALEHYRDDVVLHCRCEHLQRVWHDDDRRWLFINKPEDTLQLCLHQYLVFSLRTHQRIEIRREQPAGGRKPPDIKITWSLTNRLAYVEVKWMGASVHKDEPRVSWAPGEEEAKKGAEQLVGYLVANEAEAPGYQTMGFLVVFDGRREGVAYDTQDLTMAQALYFLARDVVYDPDYAQERHDFAKPVRCFMYPLRPVV